MKDKINIRTGATLPVLGILGSVLVVFKALGMITLPWLWVLAPFWLPVLAILIVLVVVFIVVGVIAAMK